MIYLDNAATTRMYEECLNDFKHYAVDEFYNPSALYNKAFDVVTAIREARRTIANSLHADENEIVFTASGSEADNLAILGGLKRKNKTVIISNVEHSAVYNTATELKNQGYNIVYAPVDRFGRVDIDKFEDLLDENVVFVSIMHVCNETGALNDIKTLSKLIKENCSKDVLFHVDGVQSYMKFDINVKQLGIDLFSMSAHKVHGPKGVGALYIRKGVNLKPIIFGGGQEFGLRSATENVAGINAFATAVKKNMSLENYGYGNTKAMLERLADKLNANFGDHLMINTDFKHSGPNILSVAFDNFRGEVLLHALEKHGILIGTGSACSSKKATRRIPTALNIPSSFQDGMLRISVSNESTEDELNALYDAFTVEYEEFRKYK